MTRLVLVALLTAAVARAVQPSEALADRGRRLYTKYGCYQCHGREGQGAPSTGPRLGPSPVALANFIRYVRAPTAEMPPYTGRVISDEELADIRAFLAARPGAASRNSLP
jgi:mono/diheme cytochrome c family protein